MSTPGCERASPSALGGRRWSTPTTCRQLGPLGCARSGAGSRSRPSTVSADTTERTGGSSRGLITQLDGRGKVVRWVGTCTDIEDQKGAERRFRAIIENSFDAVDLVAADGTLIYSSPSSVRLLGVSVEEQLGRDAFELLHPDDRDAIRAVFEQLVLTPGASADSVHRTRHADGKYLWLEFRATNLLFDPSVRAVVLNFRDVSDRVAAEESMRRTAELLKAVADGTTDAVFVKDRDGKYLLANSATARFVGRADGDVVGRTDAELFDPDSARRVAERDRQVMTAGAAETDVEVLTAAGVTRTYLATKAPYRDEDGAVIGVIGITRDVTELKRSEESLRASEERLRLALRGAGGGAWDWNLDTGDIWWSPELYELWGVQPGTPTDIAQSLAAIHADDRESIRVAVGVAIDQGADYRCEFRIHHPALGERWMASYGQVVRDESGRPTHLLGISLDVTERKRLAEERDALLARLQLQFERMPLAYVQFDADLRVTDWNPAAERIFGFPKDEVLGMGPPYEKIVPESVPGGGGAAPGPHQGRGHGRPLGQPEPHQGRADHHLRVVQHPSPGRGRAVHRPALPRTGPHRAAAPGGAVPAGPEDGRVRAARRRRGPRLQQPADHHQRVLGDRPRQPPAGRPEPGVARRDPQGRGAVRRADPPTPRVQPPAGAGPPGAGPERGGRRHRQHAPAGDRRGRQAVHHDGQRAVAGEGRPRPGRTDPAEPGGERPGRHADRRQADHRDRQRRVGRDLRRIPPGRPRRIARPAGRVGHRVRDDARRCGPRSSSRSSPPRGRARGPGWAWRPCTGS